MNTTGPVMTVTDELLAEIEEVAYSSEFGVVVEAQSLRDALKELRRLRAENAELAKSLAESRANDQAAMGWLTSLRWASGDRGERMLPELVAHIEWLAKDAGRYRALRHSLGRQQHCSHTEMPCISDPISPFVTYTCEGLDAAIDTAMAAK